jgi:hypothetical protein
MRTAAAAARATVLFLALLCGCAAPAVEQPTPAPARGRLVPLADDVLLDKIRGGLVGQMYGNLNGLPHEMKYIEEPGEVERYTPSLPEGAVSDDDTDIEWVHIYYMDKTGETLLPYPQVVEIWKRHINRRMWTANDYARRLMDLGVVPPLTGRIALSPVAVFNISGQFCAESYGLCAPLMPQTAARIGLHYTHVTIDGEPAQQTQLFTTMVALAFAENDVNVLLDAGEKSLDPRSQLVRIVRDTRAWCAEFPNDWRETRRRIRDKYTLHNNELPDKNGYHLNTAAIVAGLVYGKGDFAETLRLVFNLGWDADCNAATAGTILGVMKGGRWFDEQGLGLKDVYKNISRDGMPMDETVSSYAARIHRVARRVIVENGGGVDEKLMHAVRAEMPANVEPLPQPLDRVAELKQQLLPGVEKDLAADSPADKARAAYIAICLGEGPRLAQDRSGEWKAALEQLKQNAGLINKLHGAPPSVAAEFQARFREAGLEKSKGELLKKD